MISVSMNKFTLASSCSAGFSALPISKSNCFWNAESFGSAFFLWI